ncbi:MAG: DUF3971 domain-containing protein [Marinibacterium sp.]|nr:DUF3971 domain-containing protein [Marinibacterium sp.]
MTGVDPDQHDPAEPPARRAFSPAMRRAQRMRASFGRRVMMGCVRAIATLVSLTVLAAFVLSLFIGERIEVPQWVRDRVAHRIEQHLDGMSVDFGDISFVVDQGLRPSVTLRDVELRDPDGVPVLHLADLRASIAMRPLLDGQVQPKRISLSGARLAIRRHADGTFVLLLENRDRAVEQGQGAGGLVEGIGNVFLEPVFAALTEISMHDLIVRYEDGRSGRSWTADGGSLLLTRSGDDLSVSSQASILWGGASAGTIEINYDSQLGTSEAAFGIRIEELPARDFASQSVAIGWMSVLDAPLSGAVRGSIDDSGDLGEISATLQVGAGNMQPTGGTRPIPFDGAQAYLTYDPVHQRLEFDQLTVQSDWVSGSMDGHAEITRITDGALREMIGQVTFRDLHVNPAGAYETPLALDASADLRLELDPFRVTLGQMHVDEGNSQFWVTGKLDAEDAGWRLAIDAQLNQITPERLVTLWPSMLAPKPRLWVGRNISDGVIYDVDFALRRNPAERPEIYTDFRYSDMSVRFLKTLPPIRGAAGQATVVQDRLVTTADRGLITPDQGGPVNIGGTSFIIPDLSIKKAAPGIVRVAAVGNVTAFLSLLDEPPLEVLKGAGLPVDLAQGLARATGTLSLPLADRVTFDQIRFHVDGALTDLASDVLVPGQQLRAARLKLFADQDAIRISGPGEMSGVAGDFEWRQPIGSKTPQRSTVTGTAALSPRLTEALKLDLPPGALKGAAEARFTLGLGAGQPPLLRAWSDLRGLALSLPDLGWRKRADRAGQFEIDATLGDAPDVSRLILKAPGLDIEGAINVDPAGAGRDVTRLSRVVVGNWLNTRVTMRGRGRGRAPSLDLSGGRLDLDGAPFGQGGSQAGDGERIDATLDRLEIADDLYLAGFRASLTNGATLTGPFSGTVNGAAPVTGTLRISPAGKGDLIHVTAADAGAVLRAAGIAPQGYGGQMDLKLVPQTGSDRFEGHLRITGMQVRDGSTMAALLNSISVVGLIDELEGSGIVFSEIDIRFGLTPRGVEIYKGSAVGPSVGLSMDGRVNFETGRIDIQGAITPAYFLNQVGSVLTRKGEGLFSFSYRLSGPMAKPKVSVNPLSLLAPGMVRDVFRGPAPQDPNAKPPSDARKRHLERMQEER